MSKIKIVYFSGTGNTYYVVHHIAKKLSELGHKVVMCSCENTCESDDFDIIGIAFPIYTSKSPVIFEQFINNLSAVENKKLFGIVTSSSVAGDVLHYYHKTFVKKGYEPFLYENFVVANNLHLPYLSPLKVTTEEKTKIRREKLASQIEEYALKVHRGEKCLAGSNVFSRAFGILQRSLGKVHEKINFKGFHASDDCTKCGWCVRECPTSNIAFKDNKIEFSSNCIMCMRCYSFCPARAINCTSRTYKSKYKRYNGIEGKKQFTRFR